MRELAKCWAQRARLLTPANERAGVVRKIVASYKLTSGGSDAISTATLATPAASMTPISKNHPSAAHFWKSALRETPCFVDINSNVFDFAAAMTITAAVSLFVRDVNR